MTKSRKTRSVMKTLKRTAKKTLPVVNKGLTTVGTTAKNVAQSSIPVIEKGVSTLYNTMSTGLDLGVKGAKSVGKTLTNRRRSRSLTGGRRTRRRHYKRH